MQPFLSGYKGYIPLFAKWYVFLYNMHNKYRFGFPGQFCSGKGDEAYEKQSALLLNLLIGGMEDGF